MGFDVLFVAFLKISTTFPFFQSSEYIPHFKQSFNVLKRGSIIARPDIFTMRILIISWPWASLGSSSQIIVLISSFVNSIFARYWSVMGLVDESSIVKWGYQDNFKLVYFFYENISLTQKARKGKTNDFHLLRNLCARKIVALVV